MKILRLSAAALLSAALLCGTAQADVLEDMETRVEQGVGEIRLVFSVQVRYLKHFPADRGELLKVYLQTIGLDEPRVGEMRSYKRSPALALVPSYTVTYTTARDCYVSPEPLCLDIQFSRPVHYRIRPGEDGHSLLIDILPESGIPGTSPGAER